MSNTLPFTQAPKQLCILRLSAIGDVCNTVPVVRSLQAAWPDCRITWIIGSLEHSLVGDLDGVEFISFNKSQGREARKQLKAQLAGRKFDALLHMQASLRSSQLSRLIKAPIKLGFDKERAKDQQWLFTNKRIAAKPRSHVIEGLFGFAEALGATERHYRWDIPLSDEHRAFAEQLIAKDETALIISPCSSNRSKNFRNWSAENYAAVADYAANKYGIKTLLTGGPTELELNYGQQIEKLCKVTKPANLIGRTNLKQLLALIGRSCAVLAPDSGPIHMATAVGTPAIGLFASSNPERTGPALNQQWLVNAYPHAVERELGAPVSQIPWGKRVRNSKVMETINITDVFEKIDLLSRNS